MSLFLAVNITEVLTDGGFRVYMDTLLYIS
jgi:hypothetical protein